MPSHTILYCRKSTEEDDRQILSLDAQEKECHAYAERHGVAIGEVVRESHSARGPGRPLFEAMLTRIHALRGAGQDVVLLCHKPDRLLRNIADWAKLNDLMDCGVELVFVTGSYPNNAQGKMAFGINVVFAKYYVDNLSEEVRKGIREKLARGEWPGRAPMGYYNRNRQVEVDPELSPLLRRAFEYYASGEYSLDGLRERLHREGLSARSTGKPIARSVLRNRILCNPFYCGLLRYDGGLYPAKHQPLVTTALFEQVQDRLHRRSNPRRVSRNLRYRGILTCGHCACAVVGDVKKERYVYYRCSHRKGPCPSRYLAQKDLSLALARSVGDVLTLPPWALSALLEEAARQNTSAAEEAPSPQATASARLKQVAAKLETLLDLRLDGQVDEAEYAAKRAELLRTQARLRGEQLAALELPTSDPQEDIEWFAATCRRLSEVLEGPEDEAAREVLRIVGSNYRLMGERVVFQPERPFDWVVRTRSCSCWCAEESDVRTLLTGIAALKAEHGETLARLD